MTIVATARKPLGITLPTFNNERVVNGFIDVLIAPQAMPSGQSA